MFSRIASRLWQQAWRESMRVKSFSKSYGRKKQQLYQQQQVKGNHCNAQGPNMVK